MTYQCDPCVCPEQHYRDSMSWRKAMIMLLCRIANITVTGVEAATRNDAAASVLPAANGAATTIAADSHGRQYLAPDGVLPLAGTAAGNIGKAEDAAAASGDTGVAILAVRTDAAADQTSTSGDYTVPTANSFGALMAELRYDFQKATSSNALLKQRDAAANADDAGVMLMGVNRGSTPGATMVGANNDWCPFATNQQGYLYVDLSMSGQQQTSQGLMKSEDQASTNGDAGVAAMTMRSDTVAITTSTDGDYQPLKSDSGGRLRTNCPQVSDGIIANSNLCVYKHAFANVAASQTDSSIVAAVGGKSLLVVAAAVICGTSATNVTFNTKPAGAGSAISPLIANDANGGEILSFNPGGWFVTNSAEGLTVTTGAGAATGILVTYAEI